MAASPHWAQGQLIIFKISTGTESKSKAQTCSTQSITLRGSRMNCITSSSILAQVSRRPFRRLEATRTAPVAQLLLGAVQREVPEARKIHYLHVYTCRRPRRQKQISRSSEHPARASGAWAAAGRGRGWTRQLSQHLSATSECCTGHVRKWDQQKPDAVALMAGGHTIYIKSSSV